MSAQTTKAKLPPLDLSKWRNLPTILIVVGGVLALIGFFLNREQFAPPTNWLRPVMPYGQVHRGDVVVFLSPAQPELYLVKRIIGIPGDRIHLHQGEVYRDGVKLTENYVIHSGEPYAYRDEFPAVPPPDFDDSITDA